MKKSLLLGTAVLLAACNPPTPAPGDVSAPAAPPSATPAPPPPVAPPSAAVFVDKVWKVSASSAVAVGSTYAFLSDGRLVIDSPNGTPLVGSWTYENGKLTMNEEGRPYPTDVVKLDAGTFQIRSHNPGGVVDITLVPAPELPLPTAPSP